jgi:hypothetical protein
VNRFTARLRNICLNAQGVGHNTCFDVDRGMAVRPNFVCDWNRKEKWVLTVLLMEANLNRIFSVTLLLLTLNVPALNVPALAQQLVDPAKVAPEYREAAEKRRAEQIKQRDCAHKADTEKVMPRERTAFLLQCLEADAGTK